MDIAPLLKTVLVFIVLLIAAPAAYTIDRRQGDFLEVVFRNLLQGLLFTAVVVYVLVFLHMFEFISLLVVFLLAWGVSIKRRGSNPLEMIQEKAVVYVGDFLDRFDDPMKLKLRMKEKLRDFKNRIVFFFKRLTFMDTVVALLLLITMGVRFRARFDVVHLPMSDPYVHLTWTKLMLTNHLFPDGVYPMGYHTLIAAMKVLSNLDPYLILRFLGPIGGSLLVLGLYWFLKVISGSRFFALLGTLAFGLTTTGGLPVGFFRQITSLPMEFSIALVFPGMVFFNNYLCRGDKKDLLLFGIATIDVCMIHSYGALFLALGSGVLVASAFINRVMTLKKMKNLLITGIAGGIIGFLPILIGRVAGVPWHAASTSWIEGNIKIASLEQVISGFYILILNKPQVIVMAAVIVLTLLFIASLYFLFVSYERRTLWPLTILLLGLTSLLLYYGPAYCGFSVMEAERAGMFMSMTIIAGSVLALALVGRVFKYLGSVSGISRLWLVRKTGLFLPGILLAAFGAVWITIYPLQLNLEKAMGSQPLEYDSAARVYFNIKKEFPPLDWTIIAPVEQYNEALGYGYTYEIWEFNEKFSLDDARNPKFDIPFPTTYMFIYVEKIPLQIWKNYEAPAGVGPTEKYYRSAEGRTALEKEMERWCYAYMINHDNMSIYFEDQELVVYLLKHDPAPYVAKISS